MPSLEEEILIANLLGVVSSRKLAADFRISHQTVYNIAKRHGMEPIHVDRNMIIESYIIHGTVKNVATDLDISISTVSRALKKAGIKLRRGRPKKEMRTEVAAAKLSAFSPDKWESLSETAKTVYATDVLEILKHTEFPYDKMLSNENYDKEISLLKSAKIQLDADGIIMSRHNAGLKICAPFFPHRYSAFSRQYISAVEAWRSDKHLLQAIRFQLDHGDPVLPHRVRRALSMHLRTPTIFRPAIARFVYERYCQKDGLTWDPCAGYGGRLLGAFAAGVRYIATDVEQQTIAGNRDLAAYIGYKADLHCTPAEKFNPPTVDLVFTSPPYFDREHYGENKPDYGEGVDSWIAGFLRPVFDNAYLSLSRTGFLVINIADIKDRRQQIPLVQKTIDCAIAAGFVLIETLYMQLAPIHRVKPVEPILVFKPV